MLMTEADINRYKDKLREVYRLALHSTDPRTNVGAILEDVVGNTLAKDCNRQICSSTFKYPTGYKNIYHEHAERNVIFTALRLYGVQSVYGSTMYTQGIPCADCARVCKEFGVSRIVYHDRTVELIPFAKRDYFMEVHRMLRSHGIAMIGVGGKLNEYGQPVLFDGQLFYP